eukprot:CAMPEP_0196736574 /NCGR_PEP_ID=MMETSP1091-20130531/14594_1 /TAXON_ID=302021 /ORGANISM="Rhodomonas sp., Strain CCMP768" /LENGTH=126 /DNA_ID=CAMNT_0042080327 /DNA_START=184 /DNA_END=560 /DNA_ORIENTATION=+
MGVYEGYNTDVCTTAMQCAARDNEAYYGNPGSNNRYNTDDDVLEMGSGPHGAGGAGSGPGGWDQAPLFKELPAGVRLQRRGSAEVQSEPAVLIMAAGSVCVCSCVRRVGGGSGSLAVFSSVQYTLF